MKKILFSSILLISFSSWAYPSFPQWVDEHVPMEHAQKVATCETAKVKTKGFADAFWGDSLEFENLTIYQSVVTGELKVVLEDGRFYEVAYRSRRTQVDLNDSHFFKKERKAQDSKLILKSESGQRDRVKFQFDKKNKTAFAKNSYSGYFEDLFIRGSTIKINFDHCSLVEGED